MQQIEQHPEKIIAVAGDSTGVAKIDRDDEAFRTERGQQSDDIAGDGPDIAAMPATGNAGWGGFAAHVAGLADQRLRRIRHLWHPAIRIGAPAYRGGARRPQAYCADHGSTAQAARRPGNPGQRRAFAVTSLLRAGGDMP